MKRGRFIAITGPTACGKTRLAALLCDKLNGEVVSADSRQVYRRMDIGTGKDYDDYLVGGRRIPYHMVDITEPGTRFDVHKYQGMALKAIRDITGRGKTAVLCGGSGMYLESVLNHYHFVEVPEQSKLRRALEQKTDEELVAMLASLRPLHNKSDSEQRERTIRAIEIATYQRDHNKTADADVPVDCILGLSIPRNIVRQRITARLRERLENGMVEEVRGLLAKGITQEQLMYYGLEYKFMCLYLDGTLSDNDMFQKLNTAIHQFAKRQMTWFRRMERNGLCINWIDANRETDAVLSDAMAIISKASPYER